MNRIISRTGAAIVTITVFLFAVFMIVSFHFGSYLVCMFLPIGYMMMAAGFHHESAEEFKVSANLGLVFSAVYAVLIFLVYFAQATTVRLEELSAEAVRILDYQQGSLLFNYDLLGYGMMALSTFFTGLSIRSDSKADRWLKALMIIHGIFFISCFVMPITGVFANRASGDTSSAGTVALLFWCAYFLPIGVLSFRHFGKGK